MRILIVNPPRPKALWRVLTLKGRKLRHAQRWCYQMGRRVWFREIVGFLFRDRRGKSGPSVRQFWGETLEHGEEALAIPARRVANSDGRSAAPLKAAR